MPTTASTIMDSTIGVQTSMLREEEHVLSPLTLRKHLRIVTWTGFMLLLITCTSVFVVVISQAVVDRLPIDYVVNIDYTDSNQTLCIYFEKYTLYENEYTVCQAKGQVYININVNGSTTILDLHQWLTHKQLMVRIDSSIKKANDYWEVYKGRIQK
jgi:hypothetical protein